MARVRLTEEDLPDIVQELLDKYREADQNLDQTIVDAKEDYTEVFEAIDGAQRERNRLLDEVKRSLKAHVERIARQNPDVVQSSFVNGLFTVTPKRSRSWNLEKFQEMAVELGIYDHCIKNRILLETEEAHFNIARCREFDAALLDKLITARVVTLHIDHDIDGKRAEDLLDGEHFAALQEAAWKEELSSVSCSTPKSSTPL